jgi:hypothetical protein
MSESLPAPRAPDALHEAVGPSPELNRKNARWAAALFLVFVVLFAGTFVVGLVYLWLD